MLPHPPNRWVNDSFVTHQGDGLFAQWVCDIFETSNPLRRDSLATSWHLSMVVISLLEPSKGWEILHQTKSSTQSLETSLH